MNFKRPVTEKSNTGAFEMWNWCKIIRDVSTELRTNVTIIEQKFIVKYFFLI